MTYCPPKIKTIKGILPATGWYFVYRKNAQSGQQRLVCWAACEGDDGKNFIVGMISSETGELVPCHDLPGGQGYRYAPDEYAEGYSGRPN